ncbi:MAG: DNA-binding CsgD family transcriptional regulator [Reinekea sp.]|jgi:DNA-binding CsgD family transcriptional regulator|uniref:LuxR C-terminal-related transcriptional regulator n=1 Tax=Reinekea sp. TaxID=1970455 RepID=UPI0039893629
MNTQTQQTYIPLGPKELLYLTGRAHGLSNKEVAREYGVSHRTVEGAMSTILYKFKARRITEVVYKATSEGLLCAVFALAAMLSALYATPDHPYRIKRGGAHSVRIVRVRTRVITHV